MSSATPERPTILCVIGTRPEAIKLAPIIGALRGAGWGRVLAAVGGQHGDVVGDALAAFGLEPDLELPPAAPGTGLSRLTAHLLDTVDAALLQVRPDIVLAQGDTTTVMATSLNCFYRRIPFGHVESGLRTGTLAEPFPEEFNRMMAARVAELHFAPTERGRQILIDEGIEPGRIHVTGNTVIDAVLGLAARVPAESASGRTILVTVHRRENWGAPLAAVCQALRAIHDAFPDLEIVFPVHPNPVVLDAVNAALRGLDRVALLPPLGYPAFVARLRRCHLVLTDSGGLQEEAPALGKPVLVLRNTTERPEAVEAGAARLVGTDPARIYAETARLLSDAAAYRAMAMPRFPFGDGMAAGRIAAILARRFGR